MRADLFDAARRAQNYEEFKNAVKACTSRTERDREFKKNQRTAARHEAARMKLIDNSETVVVVISADLCPSSDDRTAAHTAEDCHR